MKCNIWFCVKWIDRYGFSGLLCTSSLLHLMKNVFTNVSDFTGSGYSVCYRLLIVTCYQSDSVVDERVCEKLLHQIQSNTLLN